MRVMELVADPDTYVFRNSLGNLIDQKSFCKTFCAAQRALGIRLRDPKDTYVSAALTNRVNLTWLSEQTGAAEATLRSHYGRFIHSSLSDKIELGKIDMKRPELRKLAPRGVGRAKKAFQN